MFRKKSIRLAGVILLIAFITLFSNSTYGAPNEDPESVVTF